MEETKVRNLADLIFSPLDHRNEKGHIILSHDKKQYVTISLQRFRYIHRQLYQNFLEKGIKPGQTILLAGIPGNNELFQALLFSSLSSYGVRVLMPMFMENNEVDSWLKATGCTAAILPIQEIDHLQHHEKVKSMVTDIRKKIQIHGLPIYDSVTSFNLRTLITEHCPEKNFANLPLVKEVINNTNRKQESLIITTSGSTGKSKLVVYQQEAFIKSCLSWQAAGMLDESQLGGRGFTPLFSHTMGIRTFYNALWTGHPACLINTEWFEEQPEIVRYFLLKMKPEHITGGPAAFNLLLEMARNFPELIPSFRKHFKTLVSSGAPFDTKLLRELQSVFELPVYNALGTTETQQVTNTILSDSSMSQISGDLGRPLPGVTLGLVKTETKGLYQLHIQTPFGCSRILDEASKTSRDHYFYTGDVVRFKNGSLIYAGREGKDFFKDGFGVKIPIDSVRQYYRDLDPQVKHIEYFTLQGEAGIAALIFIDDPNLPAGRATSNEVSGRIKSRFETINENLIGLLSPFEFRHRSVRRFSVVNAPPPQTAKGNIPSKQIQQRYAQTILGLRKYFVTEDWIHEIRKRHLQADAFTEHANSYVGRYLRDLKMDWAYHRAQKDSLVYYKDGHEVEVLDLVGGYGSNLLGHNYPALQKAMMHFVHSGAPAISNQGSIHSEVGTLAEKFNEIVRRKTGKNFRVVLASTGSEAVEMALHHACLEWRNRMHRLEQAQLQNYGGSEKRLVREIWSKNRQKIDEARLRVITLKSAFHGHSSAARALGSNKEQRTAFANFSPLKALAMDDTSPGWQKRIDQHVAANNIQLTFLQGRGKPPQIITQNISTIIAAIAEPITGEGGVRVVNKAFLQYLSGFDFPLIVDEIQSGLGRSGHFLASEGIDGNYYLFGKALGGGYAKISALLIESDRYIHEFGKYYVSTFSNGELAARIAREALTLIETLNIPSRASRHGNYLRNRLERVIAKYPDVFQSISGEGLMLGIRFRDFSMLHNIFIRLMYRQKVLGYIAASYLLNRHNIRILPSLSAPNILRIEPSAFITKKEVEQFGLALEDVGEIIRHRSLYDLFFHFMEDDPFDDRKGYQPPAGLIYPGLDEPDKNTTQITFLAHFSHPTDELRILEPTFARASDTGLRLLFNHLQVLMEMKPVTLFSKHLFGGRIHFKMKIVPLDSSELERRHRLGKKRKIIEKIQQAVDDASREGSEIVALGGYTSIFTNNGMALAEPDSAKIISGNTLTAASGIRRLLQEIENHPSFPKKVTLGIVGAAGNIGLAITHYMIKQENYFKKIILVVHSSKQAERLRSNLRQSGSRFSAIDIRFSTSPDSLRQCDVVMVTANSNKPLIYPQHIKSTSPVLISDNSVPGAVSEETEALANVTVIPFSSYLKLPMDPDFVLSSDLPRGTAFCCAAEAMLCALEAVTIPLRGDLEESSIELMIRYAEKWGLFGEFGKVKSFKSNAYI